ncbi:DUF1643 domain-containing protein [Gryllotalpicola daejeonensis]|uniref:DUF1643 domain-containing protein n=1 Tax=Gryllotalpicola daejeonensis TaxID=993087 RepID=A0ABP7ZDA7_9MICO
MPSTEPESGQREIVRTAELSADGAYRYRLTREWDAALGRVTFVMLNPSVADALVDDRTIGRCMGFADRWGYGGIDVVNLFAYRATNPRVMKRAADPVGLENDRYLVEALATAPMMVCAWGGHAAARRVTEFSQLAAGRELLCLGTNQDGSPKHPLYVHGAAQLVPWGIGDAARASR